MVGVLGFQAKLANGFDYLDALDKSLLFFEAQRSGKLPGDQRIKWRGDSATQDGYPQRVNLVGGYYDAGDHVKFGLPMAYSVTMLSWGAIQNRREITAANQMGHVLSAIKWGTDYFIKAHTQPYVLWGQVGDGDSDHYCWERPEDMTTPRTAYKIDQNNPGSDLAGETAAALAAASIVFRPYDSSYADLLLAHAKQLFQFADKFRGLYDDSIPCASKFYTSSGYADELLWASSWLYHATKDRSYLKYVSDNAASLGGTGWAVREFSWDNKYAGAQILLYKVLLDGEGKEYTEVLKQYQAKAEFFVCACLQKNSGYNVPKTPGGLLYLHEWNNLQYVSAAAFLVSVYSDYLAAAYGVLKCPDGVVQPSEILSFSKSQVDYILGKNPKALSYLVGYGPAYPTHIHHRGSSIPSKSILPEIVGCVDGFDKWYHRPEGNPNVIYGALLGGPDKNDNFLDDRSSYEQTEPTISGTAPLIGLFSKFQELYQGIQTFNKTKFKVQTSCKLIADYDIFANLLQVKEAHRPIHPHHHLTSIQDPVTFYHTVTKTWVTGKETQYRHQVVIKNTSEKTISSLKLAFDHLSGPLWGLTATAVKNTFELPQWMHGLQPGAECTVVYVQGGPQATISVISYE
uniref:Endoglucanase n=1 Tax=Kalanchoe fedtschenkoi TaxID=63787 RepID=A0A7N0ZXN9_KALFE